MLKQEMIHSHIMVAIFCGWEPRKANKNFPNGYLHLKEEAEEDEFLVSNDTILEELPYATDWNYLMAAYDVFRTESEEEKYDKGAEDLMNIRDHIIDAILEYDIALAFKELVRGIDLTNQLKLQEHENTSNS